MGRRAGSAMVDDNIELRIAQESELYGRTLRAFVPRSDRGIAR